MRKSITKRKTKLISKRKMLNMINLFERFHDEEIKLITTSGHIQTTDNKLYRVDLAKNSITRIYREEYTYKSWDFE